MPPRSRAAAGPPPNISPIIVGVGFIGMIAAFYFEFPGVGVLLLSLMFAGWASVPPLFNGKKDAQGRPTAADDGEKHSMNVYRMWSDLKWRLLIPNADWMPGMLAQRPRKSIEYVYPPNLVWFIAVALGVLGLTIPAHGPVSLLESSAGSEILFRAINAFSIFSIIVCVSTARRRNLTPDDPNPGVTLGNALSYIGTPKALPLFFAGGIISGISAVAVFVFGGDNDLASLIAPVPLPVVAASVFVLMYATVLYFGSKTDALSHWRLVAAKRPEWEQRWAPVLKTADESPRLVDYEEVGFFEVATFDASASMGYAGVLGIEAKVAAAIGAGRLATILSANDIDSQGQPMPATVNPRRFRVVTYPSDEIVDFTNPETDPRLIEIGAEVAMMRVIVANGLGRPVFMDAAPAFSIPDPEEPEVEEEETDEDGTDDEPQTKRKWWQRRPRIDQEQEEAETYTASWLCHWAVPNGPPLSFLADYAEDIGGEAGCEVVIDKRTGDIFFGALTEKTTPWTNPKDAERVRNILLDNVWNRRWKNVFQGKIEFIPRRESALYSEMVVNDLPIYRQPFSLGQGVELKQYDRLEDKLAVALDSAPMVAITGFKQQGDREGARHPQGMCVVWSPNAQMPSSPERLRPGSRALANEWVLTWILNRAFDHTKRLARPEIVSVKALTDKTSDGHIWEMKLRLYGGVTLAEVRSMSDKIRQSMGCQWLRVIEDAYGCTIAAGVNPNGKGVKLANPRTADRIAELNWEQAFAISGVSGHGGVLPKLAGRSVMEKNQKVSILDFSLPAGCEIEDVKKVQGKLSPATDNAFIQISPTEDPKIIRVLASERNPLEKSYAPDWDEIESSNGVPFATGVDGSSIVFDPKDTAHLMLLGLSGSGKSVAVQGFLYGALRRGWECVVINPVKGAGDYMFAEPFLYGSCLELDDFYAPAAMMRTLYEEVTRRMRLIGKYGVTNVKDLPEEVRPKHVMVILDEFTSLIEAEAVPKQTDDAELEQERDILVARNTAKRFIAQYTGKILREARAAGFSLFLATQKLTAKSLDPVPGGADMKSQLSRLLLGNASFGDKMSALRQPEKSPDLGSVVPPGRGIYEPSTGVGQIIQSWYANVRDYEQRLIESMTPIPESDKYDFTKHLKRPDDNVEDEVEIPDAFDAFGSFDEFSSPDDEEDDGPEMEFSIGEEVAFSLDDIAEPDMTDSDGFESFDAEPFVPDTPVADDETQEDDGNIDSATESDGTTDFVEPEVLDDEDLPVVVEDGGNATSVIPEPVSPVGGHETVMFVDIDGCLAPMRPNARTTDTDVSMQGIKHIDRPAAEAVASLPVRHLWLTDWDRVATTEVFAPIIGRVWDTAPSARGDEYWWKIESIVRFLDENPGTEEIIWIDDLLDDDNGSGSTHRKVVTDLMEMFDIRFLGVRPDGNVGMAQSDWDEISAFLDVESVAPREPVPAPSPEPEPDPTDDFDFEDFAKVETQTPPSAAPADDDPFGDAPAPRVVGGRIGNTGQVEGADAS